MVMCKGRSALDNFITATCGLRNPQRVIKTNMNIWKCLLKVDMEIRPGVNDGVAKIPLCSIDILAVFLS
jgi:hypothetical protein